MAEIFTPRDLHNAAAASIQRMRTYQRARAMFIKQYVGQYYNKYEGLTGDEPLNLIFNAIRIIVPQYIMKYPAHDVSTEHPDMKMFAALIATTLNEQARDINLKETLRAWIVDALFGFGILRSGLNSSTNLVTIDDINADAGSVFTEKVDLTNFVFDPFCEKFKESAFLGDIITVPRSLLKELDGVNQTLVDELPSIDYQSDESSDVSNLTKKHQSGNSFAGLRDLVRVTQYWVPEADQMVMGPDPRGPVFDDFIKQDDYYGPEEGPYTFLSFTQPVPKNPFPVAPVSVWFDIHMAANRMFKKVMDQADRQKDILLYRPSEADTAETIRDAEDGECIASDDPKASEVYSFGGQNVKNEQMMSTLQNWFNIMSGNTEQLGGMRSSAETATQAQILQGNAAVVNEDGKEILYDRMTDEAKKRAWYLFMDPFIKIPLHKRSPKDANNPVQTITDEQREAEFYEYNIRIRPKSTFKVDPRVRSKRMMEFATNILPAAVQAMQLAMSVGQPFNLARYITRIAEELDMGEWVTEIFDDPEFQQKVQFMRENGPQNPGKAGGGMGGVIQNGGFASQRPIKSEKTENREFSQETAGEAQSTFNGVM